MARISGAKRRTLEFRGRQPPLASFPALPGLALSRAKCVAPGATPLPVSGFLPALPSINQQCINSICVLRYSVINK